MKNLTRILLFAAAITLIGAAQIASADTLNLGATGWNAAADLTTSGGTSGTWSLTFDLVNGTANTVDINSFSLQLFNASAGESFTIGSATLNGGSLGVWEDFADTKLNNGTSPTCTSSGTKGWLCADTGQPTLNPYSIGSGDTATFVFSGTYTDTSAVSPLDLMASGCLVAGTCQLDGGSNNGNKWAVSNSMSTSVPEPSSLMLSVLGLMALGVAIQFRRLCNLTGRLTHDAIRP